ncbi:MAG: hypothetical protein HYR51_18310 [Candidatus Rokubacteria bacterium]|nr:hypothetical protein [Candidatus Rokubacteria bacterium]
MAELTRRYVVMTMASHAPFDPDDPEGVFVLKPWKDPAAVRALEAYRDHCYPELARDLDAWLRAIAAGTPVRGDVGRRNELHAKSSAPAATRLARTPARAKPAPRARAAGKPRGAKPAARKKKRSR